MRKTLSIGVFTVGPARRVPRSRIWLQGQRLTEAGFKPGDRVVASWFKDHVIIDRLLPRDVETCREAGADVRTVSGKGLTPIIDITGQRVRDFGPSQVMVKFCESRIIITGAK